MNLDQIARDAARDARQAGREMPIVPIGRLRRRRLLLTITPLVAVGLAAWVAILLFSLPSENATPPADTRPTPTTVDEPTASTTLPPTTTTADQVPVLDADWVRGTYQQIVDDQGEVLYEFPFTIPDGRRNTAWDGDDGFVALNESGLVWMRPEGRQTIDVPQGSIVDIAVTEAGTHVIGIASMEDGSVSWVELETGNEVEAPSGASTTDGETFSVADRSVSIEDPDWSDVERDEAGGPIPPFDLPELVVSEGDREVLRLPIGSEGRPYVDIHDFDGRRLAIAAQPQEPALPPTTVWIIDLECADCTQTIETPGPEYFDLIGVLPQEGDVVQPALP